MFHSEIHCSKPGPQRRRGEASVSGRDQARSLCTMLNLNANSIPEEPAPTRTTAPHSRTLPEAIPQAPKLTARIPAAADYTHQPRTLSLFPSGGLLRACHFLPRGPTRPDNRMKCRNRPPSKHSHFKLGKDGRARWDCPRTRQTASPKAHKIPALKSTLCIGICTKYSTHLPRTKLHCEWKFSQSPFTKVPSAYRSLHSELIWKIWSCFLNFYNVVPKPNKIIPP